MGECIWLKYIIGIYENFEEVLYRICNVYIIQKYLQLCVQVYNFYTTKEVKTEVKTPTEKQSWGSCQSSANNWKWHWNDEWKPKSLRVLQQQKAVLKTGEKEGRNGDGRRALGNNDTGRQTDQNEPTHILQADPQWWWSVGKNNLVTVMLKRLWNEAGVGDMVRSKTSSNNGSTRSVPGINTCLKPWNSGRNTTSSL